MRWRSPLKNGSQKMKKKKRRRVLRRPKCKQMYITIMIKAVIINTVTCLDEGDMDKILGETGLLLKGEISKLIEDMIIGKTKKLCQP